MEPTSLTMGVIALATLFTTCIDSFKLVQSGRTQGKDFAILETKFGNQELRLRAWGRASGLFESLKGDERVVLDPVLGGEEVQAQVGRTLVCIRGVVEEAGGLRRRYGVEGDVQVADVERNGEVGVVGGRWVREVDVTWRKHFAWRKSRRFKLLARQWRSHQDKKKNGASVMAKVVWAIEDKEKFEELVKHLKDFVDDLEDLTRNTQIPRRQRVLVEKEIELIDDMEELRRIEEAGEGENDVVSDAASARLERFSIGATSATNATTFITARTHFSSIGSVIDETEKEIKTFSTGDMVSIPPLNFPTNSLQIQFENASQNPSPSLIVLGELSVRETFTLHMELFKSTTHNEQDVASAECLTGQLNSDLHEQLFSCAPFLLHSEPESTGLNKELGFSSAHVRYIRDLPNTKHAIYWYLCDYPSFIYVCVRLGSKQHYNTMKAGWTTQSPRNCPFTERILVVYASPEECREFNPKTRQADMNELMEISNGIGARQSWLFSMDLEPRAELRYLSRLGSIQDPMSERRFCRWINLEISR